MCFQIMISYVPFGKELRFKRRNVVPDSDLEGRYEEGKSVILIRHIDGIALQLWQ